jgi:hypothetical protein
MMAETTIHMLLKGIYMTGTAPGTCNLLILADRLGVPDVDGGL